MLSAAHSVFPLPGPSAVTLARLLIVDDEEELMTALCELLTEQGYEVMGFTSGREALEALQERDFDLLLTDLMMPDLDGIALLRAGLEIDPHLVSIMMTGQGTVPTAVEAMKSGAFDYVLKPFKLNALLPLLSRAVAVHQLRMENVQLRETVAIYELNQAIAFSLDLSTILNKIADAALQQCEADEVSVMLPTREGDELYVAVVRGEQRGQILGQRVPIAQGIAGWVARFREPLVLQGEVNDPRFAPINPRADISSALSMPMVAGNKLVGVLNVNVTHRRRPFTLGQVKGLSILVNTAASALENAWLKAQTREAEEKYRSIFENAVEGIFQTTVEGRFLSANPAMARIVGYESPEELIASMNDIGRQLYVDPHRRTEFQRLLDEQGIVQGFEAQAYRKDGSVIWVSLSARAARGPNGELRYYEGTLEDITERKRAEEALQAEAQISAALAEVGREMISSLDTPVILERLCRLTAAVLGCDCSHAVLWEPEQDAYVPVAGYGDTPEQWESLRVMKVPREAVADPLAQLEREGVIRVTPVTHQEHRPGAMLLGVDVTAGYWMPLRRGEEIIGGLSAGYREHPEPLTTQRERLAQGIAQLASLALAHAKLFEELKRANQLKSDFLATMSHELRTPLNIVMGYTDLLLDEDFGPLTAEQNDALQAVKKAAHGEFQLVTDLLDVSRLEAGRLPVELSEVDVGQLLEEIKQETDRTREKPGLSWEWRVVPGLPQLHTDRRKLKVVLKNLLSNAVKFTEQGGVTVAVHPQEGGVEFCVTDTGIGIAPEVMPVIFEVFRQGDSSATRCYEGAGLGLYIVQRMLELLGGTIAVESGVGKGSTFRVWVPSSK